MSSSAPPSAFSIRRPAAAVCSFVSRHREPSLMIAFLGCWLLTSIVFYKRVPSNYLYPNFYAEDGVTFGKAIMDQGFWSALFTLFNGYFVFGIYILTEIGMILNHLIGGGYFVNLPASYAVVSYAFLGLCSSLPILLLRRYLSLPFRLALVLLIATLPMPSFDATIIGTIGNLKFAFAYIAVLLLLYRIKLPRTSRLNIAADIGIAFCLYTIASSFIVLPFLPLCEGLYLKHVFTRAYWSPAALRRNVALLSSVGLVLVALLHIAIAVTHSVGRLNPAYQPGEKIEMVVGRSFLYPLGTSVYHHLGDVSSIILLLVFIVVALRYAQSRLQRWIFLCLFACALFASVLIVKTRPEVSMAFTHYMSSGFDNFFYTQNFIILTLFVLLLSAVYHHRPRPVMHMVLAVVALCLVATSNLYTDSLHLADESMQYNTGTIYQQTEAICQTGTSKVVNFYVYPVPLKNLNFPRPRQVVCAEWPQANWYDFQQVNTVAAIPARHFTINQTPPVQFTQTFVATKSDLSAVSPYLTMATTENISSYRLLLMDAACKQVLRTISFPKHARGNNYQALSFPPIATSKGKTYCFSIRSTDRSAISLDLTESADNAYVPGVLTVDGQSRASDILFELIYR